MQIQQVPGVHLLQTSGLAQPENSLRNSDTMSQGISGFNQYVLTTKWINDCSVISLGLYFFIHLTSFNCLFLCLWFLRTGFGCWLRNDLPNWECLRLASLIKNQQWGDQNLWFLPRHAERDLYQYVTYVIILRLDPFGSADQSSTKSRASPSHTGQKFKAREEQMNN